MEFDTILNSNFQANTDAIFNILKNENLFCLLEGEVALLLFWTEFIKDYQYETLSKIDLELNEMTNQ